MERQLLEIKDAFEAFVDGSGDWPHSQRQREEARTQQHSDERPVLPVEEFLRRRQFATLQQKRLSSLITQADRDVETERARKAHLQTSLSVGPAPRSHQQEQERAIWLTPNARRLRAWVSWFRDSNQGDAADGQVTIPNLQIAVVSTGGLGDVLKASQLFPALKSDFDCQITLVTNQKLANSLFSNNPYLDHLVITSVDSYDFARECLQFIPKFDLILTWKYYVQYLVPPDSRVDLQKVHLLELKAAELHQNLRKYTEFIWPMANYSLSREIIRLGLSINEVGLRSSALPYSAKTAHKILFFPMNSDVWLARALFPKSYVTVHHGFDPSVILTTSTKTDYESTKTISVKKWKEVVEAIKLLGLRVVQLGITQEPEIPGVDVYLNGQSSVAETAMVLKHGLCHVDTEGGLVHLNRAVNGRSVVMFGPTPVELFGYPHNVNLEPRGCKACFWVTPTWLFECPRLTSGPKCMEEHSPSHVARAVKSIQSTYRPPAVAVTDVRRLDSPNQIGDLIANMPGNGAQTTLICDARSFAHLGRHPLSLGSTETILCDDHTRSPGQLEKSVEFGSLLNIPRCDSSIDRLVCLTSRWRDEVAPFILAELCRVLKPEGLMACAEIGCGDGLNLYDVLSDAGLVDVVPQETVKANAFVLRRVDSALPAGMLDSSKGTSRSESMFEAIPYSGPEDIEQLERANADSLKRVHQLLSLRAEEEDEVWELADRIFQNAVSEDGWIPASSQLVEGCWTSFFGEGWNDCESWGAWSRSRSCELILPVSNGAGANFIELQLEANLLQASEANRRSVEISVGSAIVADYSFERPDVVIRVRIPARHISNGGVLRVNLKVDRTVCPKKSGLGNDERDLGLGISRLRYRLTDRIASPVAMSSVPILRKKTRRSRVFKALRDRLRGKRK
jgi:ADP-heptose:LPS heptosyltransferase